MHMHKFVVDFLCFLFSQEVLFGFAIINKGSYRQEYQISKNISYSQNVESVRFFLRFACSRMAITAIPQIPLNQGNFKIYIKCAPIACTI